MSGIFDYLLAISICWGVFYLFYIIALRHQTAYQYNRVYLLASSLLSLIIPLLNIPIGIVASTSLSQSYILLGPLLAVPDSEAPASTFQWQWQYGIWLIYGVGTVVVGIYYFRQALNVYWVIRLSKPQPSAERKYQLVHTHGLFPTSSFYQFLLWDNTQSLSDSEIHQIMAHEETHIRQKHSYDITYITLLKIVFWFHPMVYLYEKALTENHEFAADAGALQHPMADRRIYSRLLAKQSIAYLQGTIVNHFYKSKSLQRIKMMEKRNKTLWYRYILVAPIFTSMFMVFSCQLDSEQLEQEAIAQSYEEVQAQLKYMGGQMQALTEKYFENSANLREAINQESEKFIGSAPPPLPDELYLNVFKGRASNDDYRNLELLMERSNTLQESLMGLPDADGIFVIVENQPEPEGGMKSFYQYIGKNIKYPKEALQIGVEGRVFVQFVINEYGELTDFQALKGIGAGCDEEAIRVLQETPDWKPGTTTDGKAVSVRMVLPITFKLDDGQAGKPDESSS